jgi:hypothetical protein
MFWAILLVAVFAGLHFLLLLPAQIAIIGAAVPTVILWLLWKARWIILAVVGLEAIFGSRDYDA